MLIFPCTHSMGLEGNPPPVIRVIRKSKDKQMQLNLANCAPTVTLICLTFSGISFRVNCFLCIGLTQPSKLPINIQNEVFSAMERGVYASAHRIIISTLNFNCLHGLGTYVFPECVIACMIPFEAVCVFSVLSSFKTIPLLPTLAVSPPPPPSSTSLNTYGGVI